MNDRNDDTLARDLQRLAGAVSVPPGDLARVAARGNHRRRLQQRVVSAGAVVALVGVAVGVGVTRNHGNHPEHLVSPADSPVQSGNVGVTWQRVSPQSALASANAVTGGTPLYAVSTAPGVAAPDASPPYVVYRSTDGVNWTETASPPGYVTSVSSDSSALYAVSTGSATGGGLPPLEVGSSTDGGSTWTQPSTLPVDTSAIDAGLQQAGVNIHAAAASGGVVVGALIGGNLDAPKYFPAGVTAPNGWMVTPTGVELLGPIDDPACPAGTTDQLPQPAVGKSSGPAAQAAFAAAPSTSTTDGTGELAPTYCFPAGSTSPVHAQVIAPDQNHPVTQSYTWAQLGISGDLLQAASGQPFVFFSPDGKTFTRLTLPGSAAQTQDIQVAAGPTGFVVTTSSQSGTVVQEEVWQSTNGTDWTALPALPAGTSDPAAIGYVNGTLTMVGMAADDEPAVITLNDGAWSVQSLASALPAPPAPPAGATVQILQAAIGPFGIVAGVGAFPHTDGVSPMSAQPQESILYSRDGLTWADQPIAPLAGSTAADITNIAVGRDRFVVGLEMPTQNPSQPSSASVLVGTAGN